MTEFERKDLLVKYESIKDQVELPERQRELFEAWIYSKCSMGQLALRYGINRSSVSRSINGAVEKVAAFMQQAQKRERKK